MIGIADGYHSYPVFLSEIDACPGCPRHDDHAQSVPAIQTGDCAIFVDLHLGLRLDKPQFDPVRVRREPHHTVGLHASSLGIQQRVNSLSPEELERLKRAREEMRR